MTNYEHGDAHPRDARSLTDDELLEAVRRAVNAFDPMPESVLHGAIAAFELRNLDAELLTLLSDSLSDSLQHEPEAALVRGAATASGAARELTLAAPDGSAEVGLSVESDGARRHVFGHLTVAGASLGEGQLLLHTPAGVREVAVDEAGLFSARDLPAGTVRLEFRGAERSFVAVVAL
jgi:hypothetical protein